MATAFDFTCDQFTVFTIEVLHWRRLPVFIAQESRRLPGDRFEVLRPRCQIDPQFAAADGPTDGIWRIDELRALRFSRHPGLCSGRRDEVSEPSSDLRRRIGFPVSLNR